jgi:hypothetical protein
MRSLTRADNSENIPTLTTATEQVENLQRLIAELLEKNERLRQQLNERTINSCKCVLNARKKN